MTFEEEARSMRKDNPKVLRLMEAQGWRFVPLGQIWRYEFITTGNYVVGIEGDVMWVRDYGLYQEFVQQEEGGG